MTTFQAIIYSIVHAFSEFLPIGVGAHHLAIPYLFNWPAAETIFAGTLAAGSFFALLIYFRHDWASIISSFIQVIIFRKKPMTLDERLPIFLLISSAPVGIGWYYLNERIEQYNSEPLLLAGSIALFAIPLWLSESMSRKNKGMFDWNWIDSLLVGFSQMLLLIPGCGRMTGAMCGGLARNYNREATAKFSFYAAAPILLASMIRNLRSLDFHAATPTPEISWLTLTMTFIVTILAGLLAIGGFMKHIQRKGFGQYIAYRCVLAIAIALVYWMRS